MVDIERQVIYWNDSGREDWTVALELVERGRIRHGLFFAHPAIEKLLKARVCRQTNNLAPRIHNLVRLAELAELQPNTAQLNVLADMNEFNLEGRYPDRSLPALSPEEAGVVIARAKDVVEWLTRTS